MGEHSGFTLLGNIDGNSTYKGTNFIDPTADQEVATKKYVDDNAGGAPEGTAELSTGEVGGTKFLREDGDGTCSWQTAAGSGDVSKVGTPVNSQIGVWTGDGTIEGDVDLTYDGSAFSIGGTTDVGDTTDGESLFIYRKAAEGDNYMQLYVDQYRVANFKSDANMIFSPASGGTTVFGNTGDSDLSIGGGSYVSNNPLITQWGYITADTEAKSIEWEIDDTDDYFHLSRSDTYILGFKVDMPLDVTDNVTVAGDVSVGDGNKFEFVGGDSTGYINYTDSATFPQVRVYPDETQTGIRFAVVAESDDLVFQMYATNDVILESYQNIDMYINNKYPSSGGDIIFQYGEVGNSNLHEAFRIDRADATVEYSVPIVMGGDTDWSGNGTKVSGQSSVAGSVGDIVHLTGATTWTDADADAEATCDGMLGIKLSTTEVLTHGVYTTTGLTAASTYYVDTSAGDKTVTAPSGSGDIVRIIGYALSTTELYFDPDKTYIEV